MPEVYLRGQGGLLDVAIHPEFKNNNLIYLTLASSLGDNPGGNTSLYQATLVGNNLEKISLLYKASPNTKKGQHFGSRIVFDDNNDLYFSIGDRGNRNVNPQNIKRDGGKIYRLYDDGSIPIDNPFVKDRYAKKAIYSYGHRNLQGIVVANGFIYENEHGPMGGDELNIVEPAKNYGWPAITYGKDYSGAMISPFTQKEGMEQPVKYWVPSIAPSGMAFYNKDLFSSWKGNILISALVPGDVRRLVIKIKNPRNLHHSFITPSSLMIFV